MFSHMKIKKRQNLAGIGIGKTVIVRKLLAKHKS